MSEMCWPPPGNGSLCFSLSLAAFGEFWEGGGTLEGSHRGPFVSSEARTQRKDEVEVGPQRACFFPSEPASLSQEEGVIL